MNQSLIQPYFVMSNTKYYKAEMKHIGISHFYSFNKMRGTGCDMIAVPDGCIDILIKCDESHPTAEVCGSVLVAHQVAIAENTRYFGVRFYPGEGYTFKNIHSKEIIDHQIPIASILDASEMVEKIVTAENFGQQINYFMDHYIQSKNKSNLIHTVASIKNYMIKRIIETHGIIKISELAKEMGYSERYINQRFIEFFGMQPKLFCKIIRFQHILNQLNHNRNPNQEDTLLQLALDAGYYDQSHMIKDFKQLSMNTPSHYIHLLKDSEYAKRLIVL